MRKKKSFRNTERHSSYREDKSDHADFCSVIRVVVSKMNCRLMLKIRCIPSSSVRVGVDCVYWDSSLNVSLGQDSRDSSLRNEVRVSILMTSQLLTVHILLQMSFASSFLVTCIQSSVGCEHSLARWYVGLCFPQTCCWHVK